MERNSSGAALESAQLGILFSRAGFIYLVNAANALVVAVFLWGAVDGGALLAWSGTVIALTGVRYRYFRKFKRNGIGSRSWDYWRRLAVGGSALSGLLWGAAALALFPAASLPHQIFLLVVVLGMMAGAMAFMHAYFPAFQAFFLPAASLVALRFGIELTAGHEQSTLFAALGVMFLLFAAGLYVFARKSNLLLARLLLTRSEKKESDARYRALFRGARVPMLLIDPEDGRIVDGNAAASNYYGYSTEQLRQMNIAQINTLSREEIAARMKVAGGEGKPLFHFRHRLASGEVRDVEVQSGPVRMRNHRLLYSIVHDITERKQVEHALYAEMAKNRMLFMTAGDGIHIMDEHGNLLQASDSFCRMLGYTQQEMRGMHVLQWDAQLPPDTRFEERASTITEEGRVLETRHRCKNGTVIDVEIHATAVTIEGERFIYASSRDITLRKKMERMLREREAHLHAILDNMPHLLWLKDRDGRYLAVNRQLARTTGLHEPSAVLGKTDYDLWPRELADKYRADDLEVMSVQRQKFMEEQAIDNGREYWSETFKTPIVDEHGNVLGTSGYARDITERKLAEESRQLASQIYLSSNEAIIVTDEENRIVEVNPAFTRITGYSLPEVKGKDPRLLQSGRHDKAFYRQMWQELLEKGHWQGEMWSRRKNGELFANWNSLSIIRHEDGSIYRHVSQFSDITEKKQQDELIWRQANFDSLTGLPNRRLFRDRLDREIKKSHRSKQPMALLFIDLDRFKEINDTMGHDMGDRLLVEAALRISQCVRETDTVARLGGDEFTVILPAFGSRIDLERISTHIIRELGKPFRLGDGEAYVSASIGITLYPSDADSLEGLLKNADQAMYAAKAQGRNRYGYFTESMQRETQQKLSLTNDLRLALSRNELRVHYQPIVELANGRIVKAEALLRWEHRERGMIAPDLFIPLAEESGLIVEIGEWVFREAVSSVGRWRNRFGSIIPVSVNKSPLQFDADSYEAQWAESLMTSGLPTNSIAVEITEGLLLKESDRVRQRLLFFRNGGVEVSIDDFGTGFSSLSYLRRFDIDYLKIDRSFVKCLAENESDRALVEAIIVMAHKLGIRTIAEGVETTEQHKLLEAFGCDFAQGYLYSRPVPHEEFEMLLEAGGVPV